MLGLQPVDDFAPLNRARRMQAMQVEIDRAAQLGGFSLARSAHPLIVRVVHLGRSTCYAISGRGDESHWDYREGICRPLTYPLRAVTPDH